MLRACFMPSQRGLECDSGQLDTSRTAQGGGGSFEDRTPIGEVGCCDAWMAEWIDGPKGGWGSQSLSLSLPLRPIYLSIYISTYLPTYHYHPLPTYLPVCLFVCLAIYLSICLPMSSGISGWSITSWAQVGPWVWNGRTFREFAPGSPRKHWCPPWPVQEISLELWPIDHTPWMRIAFPKFQDVPEELYGQFVSPMQINTISICYILRTGWYLFFWVWDCAWNSSWIFQIRRKSWFLL